MNLQHKHNFSMTHFGMMLGMLCSTLEGQQHPALLLHDPAVCFCWVVQALLICQQALLILANPYESLHLQHDSQTAFTLTVCALACLHPTLNIG